jgi:hypothetical protein
VVTISRSLKYEDSKNRLLLSADIFSYLIYCYLLYPIESRLGFSENIDFSSDSFTVWSKLASRQKAVMDECVLRLWDYSDFNSQHTVLIMMLEKLALGNAYSQKFGSTKDLSTVADWAALSLANQVVVMPKEGEALNENLEEVHVMQGLASGTRPTTYENDMQNRGSNHSLRLSFKRLYGYDPVQEEHNNGDDLWQTMKPGTHSLSDSMILNRLARFNGHEGQDAKNLNGCGWGEYLRCFSDSAGNVSGCVLRTVATYVVSSWQASTRRDPVEVVVSAGEVIGLMVRRGMSRECADWLMRLTHRYWGAVLIGGYTGQGGKLSDKKASEAVAERKEQVNATPRARAEVPWLWLIGSKTVNGADCYEDCSEIAGHTFALSYGIDGSIDAGSTVFPPMHGYPRAPARPKRSEPNPMAVKAVGETMTNDYAEFLSVGSTGFRKMPKSTKTKLLSAVSSENNYSGLPANLVVEMSRKDNLADYIWVTELCMWAEMCKVLTQTGGRVCPRGTVQALQSKMRKLWANQMNAALKAVSSKRTMVDIVIKQLAEGADRWLNMAQEYLADGSSKVLATVKHDRLRLAARDSLVKALIDAVSKSVRHEVLLLLESNVAEQVGKECSRWRHSYGFGNATKIGRSSIVASVLEHDMHVNGFKRKLDSSGTDFYKTVARSLYDVVSRTGLMNFGSVSTSLDFEAARAWFFGEVWFNTAQDRSESSIVNSVLHAVVYYCVERLLIDLVVEDTLSYDDLSIVLNICVIHAQKVFSETVGSRFSGL